MEENDKVLLGMSGGTDSSVAALLLSDAGYEVTGVTFRFFERDGDTGYLDDARELCGRMNIPHITYDLRDRFRRQIMDYFVREYMSGRTPVPCALCNTLLKWPALTEIADSKGIYHIATGHYARKTCRDGNWLITDGTDPDKNQSFFLWGLTGETIRRALFPLGEMTKTRTREMAAERGLAKAAARKDSVGVCFCPTGYRSFLREQAGADIRPGIFCDEDGRRIGVHEGYPFYTIGQRRGLGIQMNKAVFVKELIPEENRIVISDDIRNLERDEMWLTGWNITDPDILSGAEDVTVRIRYRKQANSCRVERTDDGMLHVILHEPLASVAPGQAAAFYRGDILSGGGIIR